MKNALLMVAIIGVLLYLSYNKTYALGDIPIALKDDWGNETKVTDKVIQEPTAPMTPVYTERKFTIM